MPNYYYYYQNDNEMKALNEIKSGKAPGLDGFSVEFLKKGGMTVLQFLVPMA